MSLGMRSSWVFLAVLAAVAALALFYPSTAGAASGPSDLRASQDGSQVFLSWTPGTAEFTGQVILRRQRGTGSGSRAGGDFVAAQWLEVADLSASARNYTDTNVQDGERYSYRVRAERPGKDKQSKSVSIKVRAKQTPPSGLTATMRPAGVVLNWTPGEHRAYVRQIVLRRQQGGSWEQLYRTADTDKTTYTDQNAAPGERYIYRIRGENIENKGGISNRVTFTVPEDSGDQPV